MPKPITAYERERIKKDILKHTHNLIVERKGLKAVTVEDIVRSAGMGKSSFYSVFKSKEVCFFEVLENAVHDGLNKAELLRQQNLTSEEMVIKFFREVYLAEDSLSNYVSLTDLEALFRKLPPEYSEKEEMLSGGAIMEYMMGEYGFDSDQAEAFNLLLDCIDLVATCRSYSKDAIAKTLDYLLDLMVAFFRDNSNKN